MVKLQAAKRTAPKPRTQEERSAATRERVIKATIDCIVEEGLQNTTAARIATRSGVTWGAIAHQFGDKDSVLFAVLERNAEIHSRRLEKALTGAGTTLHERVSAMIDVTWKYINEPAAFAFIELIIQNRVSSNTKMQAQQEDLSNRQMKVVWKSFFGDFGIAHTALSTVRNLMLSTLLGLSLQRLINRRRPAYSNEIEALKAVAVQMLEAGIGAASLDRET